PPQTSSLSLPDALPIVDRIFVAVDLHALRHRIVPVRCESGEAAWITRPHVPFGRAFGHPFGQHLAGPAGLRDAEGEDAGLVGIRDRKSTRLNSSHVKIS